jgi:hypothetical protein
MRTTWILIPPFPGSNPGAPASKSSFYETFPLRTRNPRVAGLFLVCETVSASRIWRPSLADEGFVARFDPFARTLRRFAGTRASNFTKISVAGGNKSIPSSVFSAQIQVFKGSEAFSLLGWLSVLR